MIYIKADKIDNRTATLRKGYPEDSATKYLGKPTSNGELLPDGWIEISPDNLQYFTAEVQSTATETTPYEEK